MHPSIYGSGPRTLQNSFVLPCCRLQGIIIGTAMATFNSTIAIAADQLATAFQLEPAFEHLLRNSTVHESVSGAPRINSITDRDTFVNMFDSEAALKDGASDLGFDLSTGGLSHKREFARVVTSWKTAKVMPETKLQTDAVARAHGVPVTLLPCDWTSLLTEYKNKHGKHIPDEKLPAQSMFENFAERLADGTLKAEPLSHIVSLFEEEQQDAKRPADLDRNTFIDFLEVLLGKDNFNFHKEVDGRPMISPSWSFCLSYELELRKEAVR